MKGDASEQIADVLIVNKTDYLELPTNDFDMERLRRNVLSLNLDIRIFELSALTGDGVTT